ncbi:kinase-like protein [Backusella circina FSU 941]|nr:kinase-like protein [Backusella circina FSU 941]
MDSPNQDKSGYRGRESSQSSRTVVDDEIYERPITRSISKKPVSPPSDSIMKGSDEEPDSRGISGDTQIGRYTSSTASTISIKRKSSAIATDNHHSRANQTTNKIKTTTINKSKLTQQKQRRRSLPSLDHYKSIFPVCDQHGANNKNKNPVHVRGRLCSKDIRMTDKTLGEGQIGKVFVAYYRGLPVACKTKRRKVSLDNYESQILHELTFAAKLSACKYMNRYVGWFNCPNENTQEENTSNGGTEQSICIVQRYIPNGDSRKYLYQRAYPFKPFEVLQATICLFTALTEAHLLNIGIVDLKLENFLIDSAGTGWITDFGSCIELHDAEVVSLDDMEVTWTTHVAAPEMIAKREFRKASDVFMATLIAAELMTGDLTDEAFQKKVLRRDSEGQVNPSCASLNKSFQAFFTILKAGLRNDPEDRPTANNILHKLLLIRDGSGLVE